LVYKGHNFANSEQAFMWEKATTFGDYETANQILITTAPNKAKALGRKVKNYNEQIWNEKRYKIMYDVCFAKFSQNEDLKNELLNHDNFVEASPYDVVWGIGMGEWEEGIEDPKNWKGLNLLGKVLDDLKIEFKK
jgi:hypothetical protein